MEKEIYRIITIIGIIIFFCIALVVTLFVYPPKKVILEEPRALCGGAIDMEASYPTNPDLPGKLIFKENCGMCHKLDMIVVGPPLRTVTKRRPEKWIKRMIVNGEKLKDKYTIKLRKEYGNIIHPSYSDLTKKEVNEIILYLDSAAKY